MFFAASPLFESPAANRISGPKEQMHMNIRLPILVCTLCVFALLVVPVPPEAKAFSGEDPLCEDEFPDCIWYHEVLTEAAAKEVGFSDEALQELAWHADYIDSYNYNPLWWVRGGLDRYKVALATGEELEKLHFDDLFSTEHVQLAWRRYLTGTIAGLVWAQEHDDVAAARNIVGVSLHAIQDFYSHSNWVDDPVRRGRTWFEIRDYQKDRMPLWTGSYELPEQLGVKPHGEFVPACSVLNQGSVSSLMELGCSSLSPFSQTPVCQQWKACQEGVAVRPPVAGITVPDNVVYLAPPGIALDSTWMAEVGVRERELTDDDATRPYRCEVAPGIYKTAPKLFCDARELAKRASIQWLQRLEITMQQIGAGAFWEKVKTADASGRESEYEQYHKFPYQFLSAGPYPPELKMAEHEYYLRVRLKTSGSSGAGTNADIYFKANKQSFLLDYMPRANPVIAYDDFEAGDNAVYTVGPFDGVPSKIILENRAADTLDVLEALGNDFIRALDDLATSVGDFLLSLIGGHADVVASGRMLWSPEELSRVRTSPEEFTIEVDGGDEGEYLVYGTIQKLRESSSENPADNWAEYQVHLTRLECVEESDFDRDPFNDSDEPFVLSLLVPLPGDVQKYRTEAFDDVDTGEERTINYTFAPVQVPKEYGMLSLPITVMESDDEGSSGRNRLLDGFANKTQEETEQLRRDFTDTLGAAIGPDWKLEHIEIFAFSRGDTVQVGTVLNSRVKRWIAADERAEFLLDLDNLQTLPIAANSLEMALPVLRLPFVTTSPPAPDLVGSLSLSPNRQAFTAGEPVTISATITNQGTAAAGPFWVDLFINPVRLPTAANQIWSDVCGMEPCFGIAWAVTDKLAPGESVTLTSTTASFSAGHTIWPGWFASGTSDVYLYVDSWNPGVATGAVAESDETNNLAPPLRVDVTGTNPASPNLATIPDLARRPAPGDE